MKIERINENQIKCTLTRSDLASRQIRLSELTYGTEKAKGLFQDMMEQANSELGFDVAEFPLMIEAIPVSMDCIVLMITKVDNPDEVDSRFTELANFNDFLDGDSKDEIDFSSIFSSNPNSLVDLVKHAKSGLAGAGQPGVNRSGETVFSFDALTDVIDLARSISGLKIGRSSLYKSSEDGKYYLVLCPDPDKNEDLSRITAVSSEFGTSVPSGFARTAYMEEHFEKIIEDDALESLAYV